MCFFSVIFVFLLADYGMLQKSAFILHFNNILCLWLNFEGMFFTVIFVILTFFEILQSRWGKSAYENHFHHTYTIHLGNKCCLNGNLISNTICLFASRIDLYRSYVSQSRFTKSKHGSGGGKKHVYFSTPLSYFQFNGK